MQGGNLWQGLGIVKLSPSPALLSRRFGPPERDTEPFLHPPGAATVGDRWWSDKGDGVVKYRFWLEFALLAFAVRVYPRRFEH